MKWYPYLNNKKEHNLVANEKINDDNLIICHQLETRKYALFKDHLQFKTYQERINENENCFYEIVLEKKFRNPYFDIDFEPKSYTISKEGLEKDIINNIKSAILTLIKDAIILVYSSHTEKKLSFHVVVNNYYFTNHHEGKNFYNKTIENIKEEYREYIDNSVYKSVQQFRILNSHKYGKDNKKIFREDLSLNFIIPPKYKKFPAGLNNFLLQTSLISNTAGAKYLSGYEEKEEKSNKIISRGFSSTSDLEDILNIFHSSYSADVFEFLNVIDNDGNLLITFRRLAPSYCPDCERVHENENPFVTVNGIYRNIYFYCRRKDGSDDKVGGKYIGSLGPEIIPELSVDDIPRLNNFNDDEDDNITDDDLDDDKKDNEASLSVGMSIIDKMKNLTTKKTKPKPVLLTDFLTI